MESELPDTTVVWHYMPLWKFARALSKEPCSKGIKRCALWFSRPFAFKDEMEGKCPDENVKRMEQFAEKEFGDDGLTEMQAELSKRRLRQRCAVFVNCWHINNAESIEMWKQYGGAPEGVAIQSTVGNVRYCLDVHGGEKVRYYNSAEGIRSDNIFGTQDKFLKLTDHDWENEFRLVIVDDELLERIEANKEINESELSRGILAGISDVEKLINTFVVAPGASEAFMEKIKGLCATANMRWLANKLKRSCCHYD